MRGHGKRMPRWGRLRALNSPFTHGLSLHQEVIIKIVVDVTYPTSAPLMGRSSVGGGTEATVRRLPGWDFIAFRRSLHTRSGPTAYHLYWPICNVSYELFRV